jgi:preprotein translocase subunit SecB
MNTHKLFENQLFNSDIHVESQYVKLIQFFTPLGQDFDYTSDNLKLDYEYHLLDSKENKKDFIVLLEFSIIDINLENEEQNCVLNITVEGIYQLSENISSDEEIEMAKHFGSLNLLINYLRTVFFNITSFTANGGIFLPLINIKELHIKNIKETKIKSNKKIVKKNN